MFAFALAAVEFAAGRLAATFEAAALTWLAAFETWLAAVWIWLAAFAAIALALLSAFATVRLALALAFAVLLLAASPQAIPKALSAKRAESAIIFFISKWTLLSFSKINLLIFTYYHLAMVLPQNLKFWNNRQYSHPAYISQPRKR